MTYVLAELGDRLLAAPNVNIRKPAADHSIDDAEWDTSAHPNDPPGTMATSLYLMDAPYAIGMHVRIYPTEPPTAEIDIQLGQFYDTYLTVPYTYNPTTEQWDIQDTR